MSTIFGNLEDFERHLFQVSNPVIQGVWSHGCLEKFLCIGFARLGCSLRLGTATSLDNTCAIRCHRYLTQGKIPDSEETLARYVPAVPGETSAWHVQNLRTQAWILQRTQAKHSKTRKRWILKKVKLKYTQFNWTQLVFESSLLQVFHGFPGPARQ